MTPLLVLTRHPHSRGQNISNIELSQSGSYIPCTSYRFLGFVDICAFSHLLRNNPRRYCSSAGTKYSGLVSYKNLSSPTRIRFSLKGLNQIRIPERRPALLHLPARPVSRPKFHIVQQKGGCANRQKMLRSQFLLNLRKSMDQL